MDHGEHVDLAGFDVIDDSVRPFDDFPDLRSFVLRNHPAGEREIADLLGPPRQASTIRFA
jgi:hypothetical protein